MIFNSFSFFIFFAIVIILYYIIPGKYRYILLLFASYFFYGYSNYKYILLLLGVTIISYISGLLISNKRFAKNKKKIIFLSLTLLILLLLYFKYMAFILTNINKISFLNISVQNIIVPLGISFFILQAISYPIDVYRGDVKVERNFLKYALFVSFFPQLLSGPISKSKEMLPQINEMHKYNSNNVYNGLLLILYGLFKKVVIADLLAVGINNVYNNLSIFTGIPLIIVVFAYSFQIYFDFSGYSNIAYGCGKMLGYELNKNFNMPYFANSIKNFWSRWHISLSTWFKEYLYIPLGGNRKGKTRLYLNLMIVFLVSGLWHGAAWTYVIWGALHAFYQILEKRFRLNFKSKFLNITKTFLLVTLAWIFFRANTFNDAIYVILNLFKINLINIRSQILLIGWDKYDWLIILISMFIVFIVELLNYKKEVIVKIFKLDYKIKLVIYLILAFLIIIFGHYGPGFDNSSFIYLGY